VHACVSVGHLLWPTNKKEGEMWRTASMAYRVMQA
jgi:hypothetical protein